jgi:hypothetical protein
MILYQPTPLLPLLAPACSFCMIQPLFLLTWRSCSLLVWCEYPSTLVPGLLSTVLPLLLHPLQGTQQIKLLIYIDDINNVSHPVWHSKLHGVFSPQKCSFRTWANSRFDESSTRNILQIMLLIHLTWDTYVTFNVGPSIDMIFCESKTFWKGWLFLVWRFYIWFDSLLEIFWCIDGT